MREFRQLETDAVHESPTNPRRTFTEAALEELAASVRRVGVLQPILVRPNGNGFVLIAGARRLRAAKLAGCATIPARVLALDESMADDATIIENLHREDVHPLDEAASYERLMVNGRSIEDLAVTLGKSKAYIYQRVSLTKLVPKVQDLLSRDILPLGYAQKLATVPAERQEEGLRRCFRPLFQDEGASRDQLEPLASLTEWIEKSVRMDPKAEQTRVLLPDLAEQVETAEQEKRAAVVAVSTLTFHADRSDPKPILAKSWKRAEGKDRCRHARPGVIVLGPGQGTFLQVCIAKKACDKHWAKPKQAAAAAVSAQDLKRAAERREEEERRAAQQAEREKWQQELRMPAIRLFAERASFVKWTPALFELLRHNMRVGEVFDEIVGAPGTIPVARYPSAIAIALAFGYSWRPEDLVGFSKRLRVPLKASELTEASLKATAIPAAPSTPSTTSRSPKGKRAKGKGKRRA
jgi:ParB/RepB/Spo0J family partition protein